MLAFTKKIANVHVFFFFFVCFFFSPNNKSTIVTQRWENRFEDSATLETGKMM